MRRESLKICFISSVFARYSGDRNGSFLVEEIKRLQRLGYMVQVFAPAYMGLKSHDVYGIHVYRFRYFIKKWENLTHDSGAPNKIRNPIYLFIAFFYILFGTISFIQLSRREKWDLIHINWPFPHGIFGRFGALVCGAKIVSTFYGAELLLSKKLPFVKFFLRRAIKNSHIVTAISSFTASEINKISNVDVEIIPFGITIDKLAYSGESCSENFILFAGRLIRRKGVIYLIEAMERLKSIKGLQLYIVGEGDQKNNLELATKERNLANAVKFFGFVSNEELSVLYKKCLAFVLPAIIDDRGDTEGLGIVLMEALMYKKPVIASKVGGIVDIVKDGNTGILVPEKNSVAIAAAIKQIVTKPDYGHKLGENGYKFIKENYSWEKIIDSIDRLYQRVIDGI